MAELYIFFALVAMVCYGVSDFLVKKAVTYTDPLTFAAIRTAITTAVLFILVLAIGALALPSRVTWLYLILFGFLGAVGYFSFSKAMESGKVSVVTPIINANTVVTILFAALFLKEILDPITYLMIAGVILGIILVSFNDRQKDGRATKATIIYSVITLFFWGIIFALYRIISADIGPFMTAFISEAAMLAFFLPFFRPRKLTGISKKGWILTAWVAILVGAGVVTFTLGVTKGVVSIVSPIVAASTLIAVILGLSINKERLSLNQYIGAALIIGNVILLSMR